MNYRLILFTGSRTWTDKGAVQTVLDGLDYSQDLIVHGAHRYLKVDGTVDTDRSLDAIVEYLAVKAGFHTYPMPAPWARFGKVAGPVRNDVMSRLAPDHTYAFIMPVSRGTRDMAGRISKLGLPLTEIFP